MLAASALVGAGALVAGGERHRRPGPLDIGHWLQRRLDRTGGDIYLPRLRGGRCYASRGLWVSRSNTSIASNGACLIVLAAGPVRLHSADGDPIPADAAFFISRSTPNGHPPDHVSISGLRIRVPTGIDGIDVYARDVRISQVQVGGAPFDDLYIGGRTNVTAYSRGVTLTHSTLLGAERNGISITAAVNVRITDNTIAGAGDSAGPAADPGDGIDVEPNAVSDPIVAIRISNNRIIGNTHAGIALRLCPHRRPILDAGKIAIVDNELLGNDPYRADAQLTITSTLDLDRQLLIAGNRSHPWTPQMRAPADTFSREETSCAITRSSGRETAE